MLNKKIAISSILSTLLVSSLHAGFVADTSSSLEGVRESSVAVADLDGDSDLDILITGLDSSSNKISKIYKNDGNGVFSEDTNNSLEGVQFSSVAIDDLDGDSDNDILITGYNSSNQKISKIYINDGSGNFSEDTNNSLEGVQSSSVGIADLDGDSDNDILITGDTGLNAITKIYLNDGNGNFSEDTNNSLEGVFTSSVAIKDLDGDSDLDILLTGKDSNSNRISKIYINDGSGIFSEDTNNSLEGVYNSSIAIEDLDGDSDNDILITARNSSNQASSKIYLNDGSGIFSEDTNNSLDDIWRSSVAIADLDGDSDNDILITGENSSHEIISKIYINDGSGNFELDTTSSLQGVSYSSVAIADFDGDSHNDIFITGDKFIFSLFSKIYFADFTAPTLSKTVAKDKTLTLLYSKSLNENSVPDCGDFVVSGSESGNINVSNVEVSGTKVKLTLESKLKESESITVSYTKGTNKIQDLASNSAENLTDESGTNITIDNENKRVLEDISNSLEGVSFSSVAIADLDGDGDNNILITGKNSSGVKVAKIYKNDGSGNFSEDTTNSLEGVYKSSVAIEDLDGDSDLDILITGSSSNGKISKIYLNDGSGSFSEDTTNSLEGVSFSSVAIADLDGDSDNDILITGSSSNGYISKIYLNDGSESFSEDTTNSLEGVSFSSVAIADLDGDSDNDILITGKDSNNNKISKIYKNDGNGSFELDTTNSLKGVSNSSVAIADLDGDSDNDILITGSSSNGYISKIYLNDGNGNFTLDTSNSLIGVKESSVAIADIDGDSYNDILITGSSSNGKISKIYLNDGNGVFSEDTTNSLEGVFDSSVAIADLDGDNDNDILITGYNSSNQLISKIYLSKKPTVDLNSVITANSWSMVTVPSGRSVNVSSIPNSPTIWRYDNDSNSWKSPTTLEAYKGYWIYTSSTNGYDSISATVADSTTFSSAISSIKNSYEDKFYMFGISTEEIGNYSAPFSFLRLQSSLLESSNCYTLFFYYDSQNSTWKNSGEFPYLGAGWLKFTDCQEN